jgi:hypothetical protein
MIKSVSSVDDLTKRSREFYERSLYKGFLSFIYAALALMFLGFCSTSAGVSKATQIVYDSYNSFNDDHIKLYYQSIMGGEGYDFLIYYVLR